MAEFLSQDEIDALLDIAEQGEYSEYSEYNEYGEEVTTYKYNPALSTASSMHSLPEGFYRSPHGYKTFEEAKFRYYFEEIQSAHKIISDSYEDIRLVKEHILNKEKEIKKIQEEQSELFEMFAEELL